MAWRSRARSAAPPSTAASVRDIAYVDDLPYGGGVVYCKDAFEGLETIKRLVVPSQRRELFDWLRAEVERARRPSKAKAEPVVGRSTVVARPADVPKPPFWGGRRVSMPLEEVFGHLDEKKLSGSPGVPRASSGRSGQSSRRSSRGASRR